jgi:hypothetical protein
MNGHLRLLSSLVIWTTFMTACGNKVNFSQTHSTESPTTSPQQPPPLIAEPIAKPVLNAGTCSVGTGQQVLSCLECASTPDIPAPPILSRKGQELWDIMTVACSIPNKSDPVGYQAPSRQQLLTRLIQCSPTLYPDTAFESTQAKTIHALLTDPVAQEKAFRYLYYNSASTDFETYFGLEISEARYTFCRGISSINNNGIYPIEYWNAWYDDRPYELPGIWKRAQPIRNNLRNCMRESLINPNVERPTGTPGVQCRFETAEGEMSQEIVSQANEWAKAGHSVYFEGFNQCGAMDYPDSFLDFKGKIKIAIKICE